MKIKNTTTTSIVEIESSADELRQSNGLSDAFTGMLRRCFNGNIGLNMDDISEEEIENEDNN